VLEFILNSHLSRSSDVIIIYIRFGKGKGAEVLETVLLEGTPVTRHKLQPSMSHSVNLQVKEAGQFIVWGFTTLPGKSSVAKDVGESRLPGRFPRSVVVAVTQQQQQQQQY